MDQSHVPPAADEAASFDDALVEDVAPDDDARTDDGAPFSGDAAFAGVDITSTDGPLLEEGDDLDTGASGATSRA